MNENCLFINIKAKENAIDVPSVFIKILSINKLKYLDFWIKPNENVKIENIKTKR